MARDNRLGRNALPFSGKSGKGVFIVRPIVQRGRIEVRSIWPYKRFYFRVDGDLIEQLWIKERALQFASQNRF